MRIFGFILLTTLGIANLVKKKNVISYNHMTTF